MQTNRKSKVYEGNNDGHLKLVYKDSHQTCLEDVGIEEDQENYNHSKYDAYILYSEEKKKNCSQKCLYMYLIFYVHTSVVSLQHSYWKNILAIVEAATTVILT